MLEEKYDFYSPSNVKIENLDAEMNRSLEIMHNMDLFTFRHSNNVSHLSARICNYMREKDAFTIHCLIAGYIHDIGKLWVPKDIINKNGSLTPEEYEKIKSHTTLGYEFCMKDINLRAYSDGPYYHHEGLNGTGYPRGLTKSAIPYSAQIIRVADEYDAIVTKRQYTTHVNISETLKELISDSIPEKEVVALDALKQNQRVGKINQKPLKALFKAVIDDILYEISCIMNYVKYMKEQIKRLEQIEKYEKKFNTALKAQNRDYYKAGMTMLLQSRRNS